MCIIVFKPEGVKLPEYDMRLRCELNNPDGFGFATPTKVYHSMDRKEFEKVLRANVKKNEPAFIHCRIATHGSIRLSNCHPFVDERSGVAFAHNGILTSVKPIKDKTDSETAFITRFVPVIRKYGITSRELAAEARDVLGNGSSKLIFMDSEGHVVRFGNWYTGEDGCFYSHYPYPFYFSSHYKHPAYKLFV